MNGYEVMIKMIKLSEEREKVNNELQAYLKDSNDFDFDFEMTIPKINRELVRIKDKWYLLVNDYLTNSEINSGREYFKRIGKYTILSSQGYILNTIRLTKNFGKENAWGYMAVTVSQKTTTMNNLVYRTFVGHIKEGFVIHHINHNKADNRLSNLACISRADNLRERFINNPNLGQEMAAKKNNNYVYCPINDKLYRNKTALAKDLGLLISACNRVLDGTWKQYKGYEFSYLDDEQQEKVEKLNFFDKGTKMVNILQITL